MYGITPRTAGQHRPCQEGRHTPGTASTVLAAMLIAFIVLSVGARTRASHCMLYVKYVQLGHALIPVPDGPLHHYV